MIPQRQKATNRLPSGEDGKGTFLTKKELAQMYFPDSNPRTAVNHLMTWIRRCTPLWQELEKTGYVKTAKNFTPKQIELIVEHIGEP